MTSYLPITDAEIVPGKPITNSLITRLRDNPVAITEGASGAPQINRAIISPGSSGADGAWVDATVVTGSGFFEPSSIALTGAGLVVPGVSFIRVNGNVTIAAAVVLSCGGVNASDKLLAGLEGQILGNDGAAAAGAGGAAQAISAARYFWMRMRGFVGGLGGAAGASGNAKGGGVIVLIINGNLTLGAGAKITCNGTNGAWTGAVSGGGGGGGTLIIVCSGTISGGSYEAKGGNGWNGTNGPAGGGGGGGYVALIASAYGTAPTLVVTGGTITAAGAGACGGGGGSVGAGGDATVNPGVAGAAGFSEQITLTQPQINSLMLRSY